MAISPRNSRRAEFERQLERFAPSKVMLVRALPYTCSNCYVAGRLSISIACQTCNGTGYAGMARGASLNAPPAARVYYLCVDVQLGHGISGVGGDSVRVFADLGKEGIGEATMYCKIDNYDSFISPVAAASLSFTAQQLADSPVQLLRLNETSGSVAADASTGSHAGTIVSGSFGATSLVSGDVNSIGFDGTYSYIDTNFDIPASAFTIEYVGYTTQTYTNYCLFANDHTDETNNGIQLHLTPTLASIDLAGGTLSAPISGGIAGGVHIMVTYDGTTTNLYVNGNLAATSTILRYRTPVGLPMIGRNPTYSGYYWSGIVQNFAVYASALTSTQAASHYAAFHDVASAGYTFLPIGPNKLYFGVGVPTITSNTGDQWNRTDTAAAGSRSYYCTGGAAWVAIA